MKKAVSFILFVKLFLFVGLAVFAARQFLQQKPFFANAAEKTDSATGSAEAKASAQKGGEDVIQVPEIPPASDLSLENSYRIREQLELLRQDVEDKISRLKSSKNAYDKAKKDIEQTLKKLDEDRKLLDETLQKEKKVQQERLTEALAFLEKMEPRKAGPVLEAMDRDLVIQLFRKLPQKQVTKLLESVSPKKATELFEYYTRMRSGREYALLKEIGVCKPEETTSSGGSEAAAPQQPGLSSQQPRSAP